MRWKIVATGLGVFFWMAGASVAEEALEWDAWQAPLESEAAVESEYSNLGLEPQNLEPEENQNSDPSMVPGAQLNQERPLSSDEEAALQTVIHPQPIPGGLADLGRAWKEKGYDRPVGSEEKEKRPEAIFGNRDVQEEIRKIREGSY